MLLLSSEGVKSLYDNGGQYFFQETKDFCKLKGTELHYTTINTPVLNGVAERMNHILIEETRILL